MRLIILACALNALVPLSFAQSASALDPAQPGPRVTYISAFEEYKSDPNPKVASWQSLNQLPTATQKQDHGTGAGSRSPSTPDNAGTVEKRPARPAESSPQRHH